MLCLEGATIDGLTVGGKLPLHVAVIMGHLATVRALLAAGADVSHRCDEDLSALDQAAGRGHANIASAIIEQGARVNAGSSIGTTALHVAVAFDKVFMIDLLT